MQMFFGIVAYAMKMYCSINCSTHRRALFFGGYTIYRRNVLLRYFIEE